MIKSWKINGCFILKRNENLVKVWILNGHLHFKFYLLICFCSYLKILILNLNFDLQINFRTFDPFKFSKIFKNRYHLLIINRCQKSNKIHSSEKTKPSSINRKLPHSSQNQFTSCKNNFEWSWKRFSRHDPMPNCKFIAHSFFDFPRKQKYEKALKRNASKANELCNAFENVHLNELFIGLYGS